MKYIVNTYKRTDNGKSVSYELLMRESAFKTFDGALKLARAMAHHDGALHAFLTVADGYAIAIYKGSVPIVVLENDGRSINEWYGDDIAEQFYWL